MSGTGIVIIFALSVLLESYTYFALRSLVSSPMGQRIFDLLYIVQVGIVIYAYYKMYNGMTSGDIVRSANVNLAVGIVITSLVSKLLLGTLLMLQDGPRLVIGASKWVATKFGSDIDAPFVPSRRKALTTGAALLAAIPFGSMLYGITKGKYNFGVKRVVLTFDDLPAAFNGFKIVQISDIHAGSFDSKEEVLRGVQMVNAEQGDVILFTGDLINSDKDEIVPYKDIFAQLSAPEGTYAVLGNHDYYGLYNLKEEDKASYWDEFMQSYVDMGMKLLNNETITLTKDGQKLQLVGVENWGQGRWFPKKGDLDLALQHVDKDDFCVLMSHDPTHWDQKVLPHDKKVQLTLSGHTHGMQFGISIPGFKWSPAQYRYSRWMGLYEEQDQYLYVNRGFGVLGFPGRVGMWPEITVLELRQSA